MILKNILFKNPHVVGKTTKKRTEIITTKQGQWIPLWGRGGGYTRASKELEFLSLDLRGGYLGRCIVIV